MDAVLETEAIEEADTATGRRMLAVVVYGAFVVIALVAVGGLTGFLTRLLAGFYEPEWFCLALAGWGWAWTHYLHFIAPRRVSKG